MNTLLILFVATIVMFLWVKGTEGFCNKEAVIYGIAVAFCSLVVEAVLSSKGHQTERNVLIEEALKYAAFLLFIRLNKNRSFRDMIHYGGIIGLTFASLENVMCYLSGNHAFSTIGLRLLLSTPMHIMAVMLLAYFLVSRRWVLAFAVPFAFHLAFNFATATNVLVAGAIVGMMLLVTNHCFNMAKKVQNDLMMKTQLNWFNKNASSL